MCQNQRKRVSKIILIVLTFLLAININCSGQAVEDLTDREILIQLIEKFSYLEEAIKRIEINSDIVRREIISFDRRIYKNFLGIENLSEGHKGTVSRWNILLGLFATFILGIFVFMWRKSYNGNEVKRVK